jgi:hypothetical protein
MPPRIEFTGRNTIGIAMTRHTLLPLPALIFIALISVVFPTWSAPEGLDAPPTAGRPLLFTKNEGQWNNRVRYGLLAGSVAISFSRHGFGMSRRTNITHSVSPALHAAELSYPAVADYCSCAFIGRESGMRIVPYSRDLSVSNFYLGKDASRWRERVPNYNGLLFRSVWKKIDIRFTSLSGRLLQTIIVHPGGRLRDAQFRLNASSYTFFPVITGTRSGSARTKCPAIVRTGRDSYSLSGAYDSTKRLVLSMEYLTFFGGSGSDGVMDKMGELETDSLHNLYLTGNTSSIDFPIHNAYSPLLRGMMDCFISKFACDGKTLLFSTYFGGTRDDGADVSGYIQQGGWTYRLFKRRGAFLFITGTTRSEDYPVTISAVQRLNRTAFPVKRSGFLSCFSLDGLLIASSYLGGPGETFVNAMDADIDGNVYVSGTIMKDTLWFISKNTVQTRLNNRNDLRAGFVAKLSGSLDSIYWCTYYYAPGGNNSSTYLPSNAMRIFVDPQRQVVMTNVVDSTLMQYIPVKYPSPIAATPPGSHDIVLTKITADATDYVYSTWLGGSGYDDKIDVQSDDDGNLYIIGQSSSSDYPLKNPLFGKSMACGMGAFLTKVSPAGEIAMSTLLNYDSRGCEFNPYGVYINACNQVMITSRWSTLNYPLVNAIDTSRLGKTSHVCVIDIASRRIVHASSYGEEDPIGRGKYADGYFSYLGYPDSLTATHIKPFHAYQYTVKGYSDYVIGRMYIGACEPLSCSMSASDTVFMWKRRKHVQPPLAQCTVVLRNNDSLSSAEILAGQIILPDGVSLDPPNQAPLQGPLTLQAREQRSFTWTLRFDSTKKDATRQRIIFLSTYRSSSHPSACPDQQNFCDVNVPIRWIDDPEPRLSCRLDLADTLVANAAGTGFVNAQCTYTIRNDDTVPVDFAGASLHLPSGMGIKTSPIQDSLLPPFRLDPGREYAHTWQLDVGTRTIPRSVSVSTVAYDGYRYPVSVCERSVYVPSLQTLPCSTEGDGIVTVHVPDGTTSPDTLRVRILLRNLLDTLQSGVQVECVTNAAPHLMLAAGEQPIKGPNTIQSRYILQFDWRCSVRTPPDFACIDTLVFRYRTATHPDWRACAFPIRIVPIAYRLQCAISGPDSMTVDETRHVFRNNPFLVRIAIRNAGNGSSPSGVVHLAASDRLSISGDSVISLHGLSMNEEFLVEKSFTAHTSRYADRPFIRLVIVDSCGAEFASCEKSIFLPGFDSDYACSLASPDTIHYNILQDYYTPSPFTATLQLSNHLDTAQANIETSIDLSAAPHMKLTSGEVNAKTIAIIDSHATESASYNLEIKQRTDKPITETITLRYRHPGDTEWKSCLKDILIEGEKRIFTASCSAKGHDTLWADVRYEKIIPMPFQVQHTITNNGNVPITLCSAAILLPQYFSVAPGTDSVQSFGTIQPGRSVSREWLVDVDQQSITQGTYDIRWSWRCAETGIDSSCHQPMRLVASPTHGIVFTPWMLRFRAKQNDPLPSAQIVQLWTGAASMPWQLQAQSAWLDLQPLSGSSVATVFVQPNTTTPAPMVYSDVVSIFSVPATTAKLNVEYEIYTTTDISKLDAPGGIVLEQNYPNPVSGMTDYGLQITDRSYVTLKLYDLYGRAVATLFTGDLVPGRHHIRFDASYLPAGAYVCILTAQGCSAIRMMLKR